MSLEYFKCNIPLVYWHGWIIYTIRHDPMWLIRVYCACTVSSDHIYAGSESFSPAVAFAFSELLRFWFDEAVGSTLM